MRDTQKNIRNRCRVKQRRSRATLGGKACSELNSQLAAEGGGVRNPYKGGKYKKEV